MAKTVKSSLVNLGLCLAASLPIAAQSSSPPPKIAQRSETPTLKLNPEQERGARLLNAAVGESAALPPNMHAFVLWRASYAYSKVDPNRAERLSRDAFTATLMIEDPPETDVCGSRGSAGDTKSWIQGRVLSDMVHEGQLKQVEQFLPQATLTVRSNITTELVTHYESRKELSHAESLLSTLSDADRYPFSVAGDLLTAFSPESSVDRMNIFNEALNNFQRHAGQASPSGDDIGTFIERVWKDIPPGLALEAVNKVLDAAKDSDSQSQFSISSAKGSVVLNSAYSLRLFQLLPILEELDSAKAEALLHEQTDVAQQLKAYPGGMQSVQSQNASLSYGVGTPPPGIVAQQQMNAQMQDRVKVVLTTADTDPTGALAAALALPVHGIFGSSSPRSEALLGIAEKAAAKNPSLSKSALNEFSTIQDQLTPQEMSGIDQLPALYLKIGDVEGAKKAVDVLVKAAGKIYERDVNAEDPNTAFKGFWPSADLWGKAIRAAAKISPTLPEGIIAGLQDAEIAAFEKVVFASALVGGSTTDAPVLVADCRKQSASFHTSSSR